MRKIGLLLLILCLGMAGCSKGIQIPLQDVKIPQHYELTGRLRYGDLESTVRLSRNGRDYLEFESPEGLRGICYSMDAHFVEVSYEGLKRTFSRGSLPENAVAARLMSVLDKASTDGVLEGQDGDVNYEVTVAPDSGNILKVAIPDETLELQVLDFKNLM